MDVLSHAEIVDQIDGFLTRHAMAPSRLGRDAIGEPQFDSSVRAGRVPGLATLMKLRDFMRERDEQLAMASKASAGRASRHRLSAGAR